MPAETPLPESALRTTQNPDSGTLNIPRQEGVVVEWQMDPPPPRRDIKHNRQTAQHAPRKKVQETRQIEGGTIDLGKLLGGGPISVIQGR